MTQDSEARAASVRQRMAALRTEYARRLPQRVAALDGELRRARQLDDPTAALEAVQRQAHKLHGTAGSYGFSQVAARAASIERLTDRSGGGVDALVLWSQLEGELSMLATAAARAARGSIAPERAGPEPAEPAQHLARILVVDDDPSFLRGLVRMGRSAMIEVLTAQSPDEAARIVADERLDGVLLDVNLEASEDGFALARRLRTARDQGDLCLGFMSSDDRLDNRVAAAHAGGILFLLKPFSASALQDAAIQLASVARAHRPRVLIVDDDDDFARHVATLLRHHEMEVEHVADSAEVLEALSRTRPDLLLLDVMMPSISGLEVCRTIRSMPEWRDLLVLFVSAQPSTETRMACFEAGGDDYLQKPILEQELLARTRVRLERARLTRERWERDALTGLLNRRAFVNAFAQRFAEARREGRPMSLALLDVDHFKAINDQHGHLVGDRVLASIGRHLARTFRPSDLRGRWGGEEFVVAIASESGAVTRAVLERSLAELSAQVFQSETGEPFHVTFSAGVAVVPNEAATLEQALRVADRRLYSAKAGGRAQVVDQG